MELTDTHRDLLLKNETSKLFVELKNVFDCKKTVNGNSFVDDNITLIIRQNTKNGGYVIT